jgi:hypothetical protein
MCGRIVQALPRSRIDTYVMSVKAVRPPRGRFWMGALFAFEGLNAL